MTDAERWRTVAAWFEEAAETGDFTSDRVQWGLCNALDVANPEHSRYYMSYNTPAHVALRRVMGSWSTEVGAYGTKAGARIRATLALLMAHMAEDDGGNHRNEEK